MSRPFTVVLLFLTLSCDSGDDIIAEIYPERIGDISFGMIRSEVAAIAGESAGGGIADGAYRAWWTARYDAGPYAGIEFYFAEVPGTDSDEYPLDAFHIRSPYSGKTEKHVGLGSSLASILRAYGEPEYHQVSSTSNILGYCIGGTLTEFFSSIDTDTLTSIFIGWGMPIPEVIDCESG